MSERRPFPPSPRRLALARAAGLTSASPLVVGALACGAAVVAAVMLARAAAVRIGAWIASACDAGASDPTASLAPTIDSHGAAVGPGSIVDHGATIALGSVPTTILQLALPLLGAAAMAAAIGHVAQNRAVWMPRRSIEGAPQLPRAAVSRAAFELASMAVIGAVAFGWLWTTAPRLAALFELHDASAAVGAAVASLVVALAIAWLVLGVADALIRRAQLANALAMTPTEKREDERLSAADPRWARRRRDIAREPSVGPAVARAAVVILGDDLAVAVAWDPVRQPVPLRTAIGRQARATQILALARRHRVAVHRDAALATALAEGDGPVPEARWARLADVIAALRAH